jgi:hypothetical protein
MFDFIPREALFNRLRYIGILNTLPIAIMCFYMSVLGHLRTAQWVENLIRSILGVKQAGIPPVPHFIWDLHRRVGYLPE